MEDFIAETAARLDALHEALATLMRLQDIRIAEEMGLLDFAPAEMAEINEIDRKFFG